MLEIKINITGLNPIAEAIAMLASVVAIGKDPNYPGPVVEPKQVAVQEVKEEPQVEVEVEPQKKEGPKKVVEKDPEAKKISLDDLRKAFMAKNTPENRPSLKQILAELGVAKISDIEEKDYAAAMERLEALS